MTKNILFFFFILSLANCSSEETSLDKKILVPEKNVMTIIITADEHSCQRFLSNLCDTFSYEFDGLYPIIDTLPVAISETLIVDDYIKENGFTLHSSGHGNWQYGPRFVALELIKDDCHCKVFKKYYYNEKLPDGSYNLRVTEKVVCNAANNALD